MESADDPGRPTRRPRRADHRLRVRGREHPGAAGLPRHRPRDRRARPPHAGRLGPRRPRRPASSGPAAPASACSRAPTPRWPTSPPATCVATRGILAEPASFPDVVAQPLRRGGRRVGRGPRAGDGRDGPGDRRRRRAAAAYGAFTAAEHARGAALAELVADVLAAAARAGPRAAGRAPAAGAGLRGPRAARCGPSCAAPSSARPRGPSTTSGRGTSSWGSTRPGGVAASGPDCSLETARAAARLRRRRDRRANDGGQPRRAAPRARHGPARADPDGLRRPHGPDPRPQASPGCERPAPRP